VPESRRAPTGGDASREVRGEEDLRELEDVGDAVAVAVLRGGGSRVREERDGEEQSAADDPSDRTDPSTQRSGHDHPHFERETRTTG